MAADFEAHDHCSCTSEPVYEGSLTPPEAAVKSDGLFYESASDAEARRNPLFMQDATEDEPANVAGGIQQDRRDLALAESDPAAWTGDDPEELRERIAGNETWLDWVREIKRLDAAGHFRDLAQG